MPKEELNLLQFPSGRVAELRARSSQVVRRKSLDTDAFGSPFYDMPNCLGRERFPPYVSKPINFPENATTLDLGCRYPIVYCVLHPDRYRNRSNMFRFSY